MQQPASTTSLSTESNSMPKGQKSAIDTMNSKTGLPNLKDTRNTGENKAGSSYLRKNQMGQESSSNQ